MITNYLSVGIAKHSTPKLAANSQLRKLGANLIKGQKLVHYSLQFEGKQKPGEAFQQIEKPKILYLYNTLIIYCRSGNFHVKK